MISSIKFLAKRMFESWMQESFKLTCYQFESDIDAKILDLGCGGGEATVDFSRKVGSKNLHGLEIVDSDIKNAKKRGIVCKKGDLNKKFPFNNGEFDVIISHFSIEHLIDTHNFVKESFRVLKKGGYVVVASDNLTSWLNILAMILTFQPFSLVNGICDVPVGNPFSLRTEEESKKYMDSEKQSVSGARSHIRVLSLRAVNEAYKNVGFELEFVGGAGYFPFSGWLSRFFSKIDPFHSHFYIIKVRKP